uniref:Uncharacterized protein n=1 Tax=Aegilops tauschii subsp. strangulata TaxID=200361 RepID=A0A453T587_AEGTS
EAAMGPVRLERVVFALNGRRHEMAGGDVHPSTTLLEFIRTRTPFTGTKLGCGEGAYSYGVTARMLDA